MAESLTVFILMLLVNGQGMVGQGYSTLEDCQEERAQTLAAHDVLYASECIKVEVAKVGVAAVPPPK